MKLLLMKACRPLLFLSFLVLSLNPIQASHLAGGNLSFKHISGGGASYEIRMDLFRDCSGSGEGNEHTAICVSTCGDSLEVKLVIDSTSFIEISREFSAVNRSFHAGYICSVDSFSQCQGGSYTDFQRFVYRGVASLPPCENWRIYSLVGGRNFAPNLDGGNNFSLEMQLNNLDFVTNSGPRFQNNFIPTFCTERDYDYNFSSKDIDGDELRYKVVCGYDFYPAPNTFTSPFTCELPLSDFTLDEKTGRMRFNGNFEGPSVMVVEVSEYDRSGTLKSKTIQDLMINFVKCLGTPRHFRAGDLQNVSGSGQQTDSLNITLHQTEGITFRIGAGKGFSTDSFKLYHNFNELPMNGTAQVVNQADSIFLDVSIPAQTYTNPGYYDLLVNFVAESCPNELRQEKLIRFDISPNVNSTNELKPSNFEVFIVPESDVLRINGPIEMIEYLDFYALDGRLVVSIDEANPRIPLSDLSNALYVVRLGLVDGRTLSSKVILAR